MMLNFAAINDEDAAAEHGVQVDVPTKEAQEFQLTEMYEEALNKMHAGELDMANSLLQSILQSPLLLKAQMENASSANSMLHLRFSALKNLAEVLVELGPKHHGEALHYYLQAAAMDDKDVNIWNRLGTVAVSLERFFIARRAFEQGLRCSPRNWLCMEKLLEVLIAIGDELACCAVAKKLLGYIPSHPRARYILDVVDGVIDYHTINKGPNYDVSLVFPPRGVDLLEPMHHGLSFPPKRKWSEISEGEELRQKKRRLHSIVLRVTEASWVAIVKALGGVLQDKPALLANYRIGDDELSLEAEDGFRIANAHLKISVCLPEPDVCANRDASLSDQDVTHKGSEELGAEHEVVPSFTDKPTFQVGECTDISKDNGMVIATDEMTNLKSMGSKESDGQHDFLQERRSSRIERLRTGTTLSQHKCEDSNEKGKHVKDLRSLLKPFVVFITPEREGCKDDTGRQHIAGTEPKNLPSGGEKLEVQKFLNGYATNSGVYYLGEQLLEELASFTFKHVPDYLPFLELEKLTRNSSKRSVGCSLFLAELYADLAATTVGESISRLYLEDAKHNMYRILGEYGASHIEFVDASATITCPSPYSSNSTDAGHERGNSVTSGISSGSYRFPEMGEDDWPIWVRYHWLNGRIQILSGNQEKGLKHFRTCQILLATKEQTNHTEPYVALRHCKVDSVVTAVKVKMKIGGLQIVDLIRNSAKKSFQQGEFQDVIDKLTPILLPEQNTTRGKAKLGADCSVQGIECCDELVGLSLLLSASSKVKRENVVVALQCHQRRLEMLCHVLGTTSGDWGEGFGLPSLDLNSLQQEDVKNRRHADRAKLIAEEVKSISRCAARSREMMETGVLAPSLISPSLVGRIQELLLTVMEQHDSSLQQCKSVGHGGASLADDFRGVCLVDAAVAFCRLKHLHVESSITEQVSLLVTVHDLLAEHGLCCAGKNCEGGEGAFLNMSIKHLGALDLRLKLMNSHQLPAQFTAVRASEEHTGMTEKTAEALVSKHKMNCRAVDEQCVAQLDRAVMNGEVKELSASDTAGLNVHERKQLESAIDYALDQSFFCLYGLNLRGGPEITSAEGIAEHKNTNKGDYQTKDQCAGVLQYILPYVKSCSRFRLLKLKKVLRAVWAQFPHPPSEVLAKNSVDSFLDDPNFDEGKLYQMTMSRESVGAILEMALGREHSHKDQKSHGLCEKGTVTGSNEMDTDILDLNGTGGAAIEPSTEQTSGSETFSGSKASNGCGMGAEVHVDQPVEENPPLNNTYSEVYENLYYLLAQIEDMSASDKCVGFILTKEGEDFIEQNSNLVKYDLIYNPARFESWHRLAHVYDEDVDLMLNDGSKKVNAQSWRRKSNYAKRVDASRRRSRRCFLISLALSSTPEQQSEMHGLLALVYFDTLQNVAPSYDQQQHRPIRDASWLSVCEKAFFQFEKALSYRPDWTHLFYLGKLSEKMGKQYTESLYYFGKAVKMNPNAVDTFYRLHASRLKLLCKKQLEDIECLQALSEYSFFPTTRDKVLKYVGTHGNDHAKDSIGTVEESSFVVDTESSKRRSTVSEENLGKAWKVLFDDCMSGLQVCVDGDLKHFHKARYRIAQGFCHLGRDEDIERAKEELSFCFKSHRSSFIVYMWEIDDSSRKNKRKATSANCGKLVLELAMQESSRKFITCVRKYLLLYLTLCERTGDLNTLERAYVTLRADKKFSICLEDISQVALGHYIRTLSTAVTNARRKAASTTSVQSLLDKMFNVFLDHGTSWTDAVAEARTAQAPEGSIYSYIHEYFYNLESTNNVEGLEAVNERIRKRFKSPKLAGASCLQVCRHAALSWCRALCVGLSTVTPLHPEKPQSDVPDSVDQQPRLIVDLDQNFSSASDPVDSLQASRGYAYDDNSYGGVPPIMFEYSSQMRNIHVTHVGTEGQEKATTLLRSAYIFYRETASQSFPSGINLYLRGSQASLTGFGQASASRASQVAEPLDISTPRKLLLWAFTLVHGQPCSLAEVVRHCEEQAKARFKKGSPAAIQSFSGQTSLQGTSDVDANETTMSPVSHQLSIQYRDSHNPSSSLYDNPAADVV